MKSSSNLSLLFSTGSLVEAKHPELIEKKLQAIAQAPESERLKVIELQLTQVSREKRKILQALRAYLKSLQTEFHFERAQVLAQLNFKISQTETKIKKDQDAYRLRLSTLYRAQADNLGLLLGIKSTLAQFFKKRIYQCYAQLMNAKPMEKRLKRVQFNRDFQAYAEINQFGQFICRSQDLINHFAQTSLEGVRLIINDLIQRLKMSEQEIQDLNADLSQRVGEISFTHQGLVLAPTAWAKSLEDHSNKVRAEVEVLHAQQLDMSEVRVLSVQVHQMLVPGSLNNGSPLSERFLRGERVG